MLRIWLTSFLILAGGRWAAAESPPTVTLDLSRCLEIALESNQRGRISRRAIEVAEAQLQQARSAYWPQVALRATALWRDQDPVFVIPAQSDTFRITGLLPTPVVTRVSVPPIEAPLLDRRHLATSLNLVYPIYTGGLRPSLTAQARAGVEAARQAARRSRLEVIRDTRHYYCGAILSRRLLQLAEEALARLEVTMALTHALSESATGRVTRADYLELKVVVESVRAAVAHLRANESTSRAAVVYAIGLPWNTELVLAEDDLPFEPVREEVAVLVEAGYRLNPDWHRLAAAIDAAGAQVDQALSGQRPTVAAAVSLEYLVNSYDAGLVSPDDKRSWAVGVALEWPVFDGLRTRNTVRAARARLDALQGQKILLREGLALQVRSLLCEVARTTAQEEAVRAARDAAQENRELNTRAYQAGLVEVEDLIRAQMVEALAQAQYELVRYEHAAARADLEFAVGDKLSRVVGGVE